MLAKAEAASFQAFRKPTTIWDQPEADCSLAHKTWRRRTRFAVWPRDRAPTMTPTSRADGPERPRVVLAQTARRARKDAPLLNGSPGVIPDNRKDASRTGRPAGVGLDRPQASAHVHDQQDQGALDQHEEEARSGHDDHHHRGNDHADQPKDTAAGIL